jgi:hypothetical protein
LREVFLIQGSPVFIKMSCNLWFKFMLHFAAQSAAVVVVEESSKHQEESLLVLQDKHLVCLLELQFAVTAISASFKEHCADQQPVRNNDDRWKQFMLQQTTQCASLNCLVNATNRTLSGGDLKSAHFVDLLVTCISCHSSVLRYVYHMTTFTTGGNVFTVLCDVKTGTRLPPTTTQIELVIPAVCSNEFITSTLSLLEYCLHHVSIGLYSPCVAISCALIRYLYNFIDIMKANIAICRDRLQSHSIFGVILSVLLVNELVVIEQLKSVRTKVLPCLQRLLEQDDNMRTTELYIEVENVVKLII